MAYSDFKLETIQQELGLTIHQAALFATVNPIEPTIWLKDTLNRGHSLALLSEKSRSEFIIAPMLLTCRELCHNTIYVYSGINLDVDADLGLKGECDFIVAKTDPTPALQAPLVVILEAKKNDIEGGLAQCAAQMVGAQRFNQAHHSPTEVMFGCVTTGEVWQFLKLEGQTLYVNEIRYYLNQLPEILGILITIANNNDIQGDVK